MISTMARLVGTVALAVFAATPLRPQEETEETVFINMRALSAVELHLYQGFKDQIDSMDLEEGQVRRMLREISKSSLFDAAQSSLRRAVIQRLRHGAEEWLLGLLESSQVEIQLVTIAAVSESALTEPVVPAQQGVIHLVRERLRIRARYLLDAQRPVFQLNPRLLKPFRQRNRVVQADKRSMDPGRRRTDPVDCWR